MAATRGLNHQEASLNELALFAGAGGGILGGHLLGWRTICAVERDAYAAGILAQRQNDRILAPFPIWSDVTTFDGRPWRGRVDVVSGGFPCQDISAAGRGAGIDGERSGLWREMERVICEVEPRFVYVENSPMLTSRGLGTVLGDMAALGFNARWGVLSAADVGAPHLRERIWIFAYSNRENIWQQPIAECGSGSAAIVKPNGESEFVANSDRAERRPQHSAREGWAQQWAQWQRTGAGSESIACSDSTSPGLQERKIFGNGQSEARQSDAREIAIGTSWWESEPDVDRVADGVAYRVDRLKAIGNGQVPAVAAAAFSILSE
jgi:DNA (cytosine-5)-methyltransferase 1